MTCRSTIGRMLATLLLAAAAPAAVEAQGTDQPLPHARTEITPALAQALRNAPRFADVEAAMGGPGARIGHSDESDGPHDVVAWTGRGGRGLARAFLFANGDFSLVLRPAGAQDDLILNSFGAFVCPSCEPPVNACGRRPWWVPHDVHFDTFDCGCSLAGPQSVGVGKC